MPNYTYQEQAQRMCKKLSMLDVFFNKASAKHCHLFYY